MRVAYITRSFPRLSQTFILNEILALEQLGLRLQLFAMTNPREAIVQPEVAQVRAPVVYLDEGGQGASGEQFPGYERARRYVEEHAELDAGYTTASRFACFEMAVYLAHALTDGGIGHIHAHFAHDPTLVAQLASILTGIPYSFTAHARDLYQIPVESLIERVAGATAVATCSAMNIAYFREVLPPALLGKVRLIYHGVDTDRFQPAPRPAPNEVPEIISIGRLVEKKGFGDLLAACGRLHAAGQPFHCTIYGEGPLHDGLLAQAADVGLAGAVAFPGACPQRELVVALQRADLFALTPFVTEDGDRDGVPNVLVEAMACGLPVVSTAVVGVPELVRPGVNGLLAPARDVAAIADALGTLLRAGTLRAQMGAAARQTVLDGFDLRAGARQMRALFGIADGRLQSAD